MFYATLRFACFASQASDPDTDDERLQCTKLQSPAGAEQGADALGPPAIGDVDVAELVRQHLLGNEAALDAFALDELLQTVTREPPVESPGVKPQREDRRQEHEATPGR